MNSNHKHRTFQTLLYILAIFGVSAGIYNALRMLNVLTPTVHAQQDPFLERRISQIEQRYSFTPFSNITARDKAGRQSRCIQARRLCAPDF